MRIMRTDIKSLLEFAGVDTTQGKAKMLVKSSNRRRVNENIAKDESSQFDEEIVRAAEEAMEDATEAIVRRGQDEPTKEAVMHYLATKMKVKPEIYDMAHRLQYGTSAQI